MKSEGKGGWGRGCKLVWWETAAFWTEMLPTARAAAGMLPGSHPACGTEHTQVTWVSHTSTKLCKPFALNRGTPAPWREGQWHRDSEAV